MFEANQDHVASSSPVRDTETRPYRQTNKRTTNNPAAAATGKTKLFPVGSET